MTVPQPGRFVEVGGHRLHLNCGGSGGPAVIFDAALGASSLSWSLVQPAVAAHTCACAYDRAGFGWSDAGPLPRTASRIAAELDALIDGAAIPPPYILVGHSFGGLVMPLLFARRPQDVAAMVLIEPAIPGEWIEPDAERRAMIARGVRLCGYGATAARYGFARLVAALVALGRLGLARAVVKAVSRGGLQRADEGILAPIWRLPPEARAVLRHTWTQPKFFAALGSQIASISESARQVRAHAPIDYGRRPLVVMTSSNASDARLQADRALAASAPRGQHVLVDGTGHWIPLDAPAAVIDTILSLIHECRRAGAT